MQLPDENRRYLELAEKWMDSTITPEEEIEFSDWYNANQEAEVLLPASFSANENELKEKIFYIIQKRKREAGAKPVYRQLLFRAAAAAILIMITGTAFFYFTRNDKAETTIVDKQAPSDIPPGGNKAVLTLADGSQIILDNAGNGTLSQQGNTKILKLDAGQLSYLSSGTKKSTEVFYNTISTPRGGQYQITLPDGTKVWLNASSSLRFPTAFTGKQRDAALTGEAYFEVTKNAAMPFTVTVNGMAVQVLGTHFNINSYSDEATVKTTLLEGVVKVINGKAVAMLAPGQQAATGLANQITINKNADTDEAIAWKNGSFIFNSANVATIMRQISRWYDVDVSYSGKLSNETFSGVVNRNSNISQVLKILEQAGMKFIIQGKTIVVAQ